MKLFSKNKWSDEQLVTALKDGGYQREVATQYLLKQHINYAYKLHHQLKIGKEEARDALVDSVLAIISQIERGAYSNDRASLTTYLYRIIYNKCVDFARKRTSNKIDYPEQMPDAKDHAPDIIRVLAAKGDVQALTHLLNKIGDTCQQILLDWGAGGYSMAEIAERAGLKDAGRAKRQKYNCLQKLMKLIQESRSSVFKK
ncbi:MAG: sigma-70 family RNA polymerase sigma factor [Bacteroidota bacterium]